MCPRQAGAADGAGCRQPDAHGLSVYPAPVHELGANNQLLEVFRWTRPPTGAALVPGPEAELSTEYVFRGQTKQRLIFYPLRFNPAQASCCTASGSGAVEFVEPASVQSSGGRLRAAAAAVHRPGRAGGCRFRRGGLQGEHRRGGIYRITRDWLTAQGIGLRR